MDDGASHSPAGRRAGQADEVKADAGAPPGRADDRRDGDIKAGGVPIALALSLGFGGLVAATVALVLFLSLSSGRESAFALAGDKADLILATIEERVALHLEPAVHQSAVLSDAIARGNLPPDDILRLSDYASASLAATPQIAGLVYIDAEHQVLRIRNGADGIDIDVFSAEGDERIAAVMAEIETRNDPFWGRVEWSDAAGQPVVNLRTAVRRDDRFLGAVIGGITVGELSRFLNERTKDLSLTPFILYGFDRVLAHHALIDGGVELSADKPLPAIADVGDPILNRTWLPDATPQALPAVGETVQAYRVDFGDAEYAVLFRTDESYGTTPWVYGVYMPLDAVTGEFQRLLYAAVAGVAVLLVALVLALLIGRAMARPVHRLAEAAHDIEDLDFDAAPIVSGGGFKETREAAAAFNAMRAGLRAFAFYVPRSLVRRLVKAGDGGDIRPEERSVTVMFTDIVGFTALAQGAGAAGTSALLNDHFALVTECIEAREGTVDKYIGDSVMAFWGAPEHQPDHARRAIDCARAVLARLEGENAERAKAGQPPLRIRIGIHSGDAIVGNVGSRIRVDYTLVGDTVNIASRLVDLAREYLPDADAGVILISDATAGAAGSDVPVEPIGTVDVRGRAGRLGIARIEPNAPPPGVSN